MFLKSVGPLPSFKRKNEEEEETGASLELLMRRVNDAITISFSLFDVLMGGGAVFYFFYFFFFFFSFSFRFF